MSAFHRTDGTHDSVTIEGFRFVVAVTRANARKGRVHWETRMNSNGELLYCLPGGEVATLPQVKAYARRLSIIMRGPNG